jgi:hypothetical protein
MLPEAQRNSPDCYNILLKHDAGEFCSGYLHLPTVTKTVTSTATINPVASKTVRVTDYVYSYTRQTILDTATATSMTSVTSTGMAQRDLRLESKPTGALGESRSGLPRSPSLTHSPVSSSVTIIETVTATV